MDKRIKILCICVSVFFFTQTAAAQKLSAETSTIDVGQVLFNSPASASFVVLNKSLKTANITSIETSCGCVTAAVDENSKVKMQNGKLDPKQTMGIEVTYDGRTLGKFQKQIWINYQGTKKPLELTIRGTVVNELIDYAGTYPYKIGEISADKRDVEFDDVNRGQRPTSQIHILNTTGKIIQPVVMHMPSYLSAEVSPTKILPGRTGVVTLTLLSEKLRDNGLTQTSVFLGRFPGDKVSSDKEITSSVVLLPSFDGMTQSQEKAEIQVSDTVISLLQFTGNPTKLKKDIIIQNTGKALLNISSLQMFTSGLSLRLPKSTIKPGEYVKLHVTINKTILQAQHTRPRILMITNDPTHPKVIISINP